MHKANLVKKSILESEWSPSEWADRMGVSRQTIYDWINCKHLNIRKFHIVKIANVLGKKIHWLDETYENVEFRDIDQDELTFQEGKYAFVESNQLIKTLTNQINYLMEELNKSKKQKVRLKEISYSDSAFEEMRNLNRLYREQFDYLFEQSTEAIWMTKRLPQKPTVIVRVNSAVMEMYGATHEGQLVGGKLENFVHPDYLTLAKRYRRENRSVFDAKVVSLNGHFMNVRVDLIRMVFNKIVYSISKHTLINSRP